MTNTNTENTLTITLKGRGKAKREAAYHTIAPLAFVETESRADTIAAIRNALGNNPDAQAIAIARQEYAIGRVASRLPLAETKLGKAPMAKTEQSRLSVARLLVTSYAQPPAATAKAAPKLRRGKIGYRSVTQHKVVRAAEEAWSQVKAELGLGTAQTQAERNAKKRAPHRNGKAGDQPATKKAKIAAAKLALDGLDAGTVASMVKPPKPETRADVVAYIEQQAATLLQFVNKHAGLVPASYGAPVKAFQSAIATAAKGEKLLADIAGDTGATMKGEKTNA